MRQILCMALALVFISPAFGVKVTSLYHFEIPVVSQADDVRLQAVREGFLRVLIKVSGDPQIANNPSIKPSLTKADYYVQEFSYSTPRSSPYYLLNIRYDRNEVNRLLRKAGIAYWGENRPLIMVWIAFTDNKKFAEIIGNETRGDILSTMKQEGTKSGLPLIFPMLDVTDISQVSTSDIDSMAINVLQDAAKRYSPDALLVGSIHQTNIEYQSQWHLLLGKNQWDWNMSDRLLSELVTSVLNQVNQTLARYYVEKAANEPQWIKLEVTNITKRDDLVELMRYLKQLTVVQQVQLSQVQGDVVDISILLRGSLMSFQQNAAVGQRLVLKSQDENTNTLVYEWMH